MKELDLEQMVNVVGGRDGWTYLGVVSCGLAAAWPIGTALFGPTCVGMIVKAAMD